MDAPCRTRMDGTGGALGPQPPKGGQWPGIQHHDVACPPPPPERRPSRASGRSPISDRWSTSSQRLTGRLQTADISGKLAFRWRQTGGFACLGRVAGNLRGSTAHPCVWLTPSSRDAGSSQVAARASRRALLWRNRRRGLRPTATRRPSVSAPRRGRSMADFGSQPPADHRLQPRPRGRCPVRDGWRGLTSAWT